MSVGPRFGTTFPRSGKDLSTPKGASSADRACQLGLRVESGEHDVLLRRGDEEDDPAHSCVAQPRHQLLLRRAAVDADLERVRITPGCRGLLAEGRHELRGILAA